MKRASAAIAIIVFIMGSLYFLNQDKKNPVMESSAESTITSGLPINPIGPQKQAKEIHFDCEKYKKLNYDRFESLKNQPTELGKAQDSLREQIAILEDMIQAEGDSSKQSMGAPKPPTGLLNLKHLAETQKAQVVCMKEIISSFSN